MEPGRRVECSARARPTAKPTLPEDEGAQFGATELGIKRALHGGVPRQRNGLYRLPRDENLRDFVKSRFDPIFETSPALAGVKPDKSSWRQKLIGAATLYFRGSNTKSGLLEIPVDQLIIDEFDACLPASVKLAEKRLGGIPEHLRRILKLSTPTIAGLGVDRAYRASDQCAWVVPCPHCGEGQSLEWGVQLKPDDSDPNARPPWRCRHCGDEWTEAERLEAIEKGAWVAENPGSEVRGYRVSRLYSPMTSAAGIIGEYWEAKLSDDPEDMRTFMNSELGLPWSEEGERITDEILDAAREAESYSMRGEASVRDSVPLVSMGVDVGTHRLHVVISEWTADGAAAQRIRRNVAYYTVSDFEDLDEILLRHRVSCCVVDSLPDQRKSVEFQGRFPDIVWLAMYSDSLADMVQWVGFQGSPWGAAGPLGLRGGYVRINRSHAFDVLFGRYLVKPQRIREPLDMPKEARTQLKALYVVLEPDRYGNLQRRYKNSGADHYGHASLYAEVAGLQVGGLGPAEIPRERGDSRDVADPTSMMMDDLGREISGI